MSSSSSIPPTSSLLWEEVSCNAANTWNKVATPKAILLIFQQHQKELKETPSLKLSFLHWFSFQNKETQSQGTSLIRQVYKKTTRRLLEGRVKQDHLIKAPEKERWEAVTSACVTGNTVFVRKFWSHIEEWISKKDPKATFSLIHSAVIGGNKEVVKRIIEKDPNQLTSAASNGALPIHLAIVIGHLDIVKLLLEKDPTQLSTPDEKGNLLIHKAVVFGQEEIVSFLLEKDPRLHNWPSHDGTLPIQLATFGGHIKIMESLLKKDPEQLNVSDSDGNLLIHLAAEHGQIEAARFLLKKDPYLLVKKSKDSFLPIHTAASFDHVEVVQFFLEKYPGLIDKKTKKRELPIQLAARRGCKNVFKILLDRKPTQLYVEDHFGWPLIHTAVYYGQKEIIKILLKKDPLQLTVEDSSGDLPIHTAVWGNQLDTVQYLLDINLTQCHVCATDGYYPITIAAKKKNTALVDELLATYLKTNLSKPIPGMPIPNKQSHYNFIKSRFHAFCTSFVNLGKKPTLTTGEHRDLLRFNEFYLNTLNNCSFFQEQDFDIVDSYHLFLTSMSAINALLQHLPTKLSQQRAHILFLKKQLLKAQQLLNLGVDFTITHKIGLDEIQQLSLKIEAIQSSLSQKMSSDTLEKDVFQLFAELGIVLPPKEIQYDQMFEERLGKPPQAVYKMGLSTGEDLNKIGVLCRFNGDHINSDWAKKWVRGINTLEVMKHHQMNITRFVEFVKEGNHPKSMEEYRILRVELLKAYLSQDSKIVTDVLKKYKVETLSELCGKIGTFRFDDLFDLKRLLVRQKNKEPMGEAIGDDSDDDLDDRVSTPSKRQR